MKTKIILIFFILISSLFISNLQAQTLNLGKGFYIRVSTDTNVFIFGRTTEIGGLRLKKDGNGQLFNFNASHFFWDNTTGLNLSTSLSDSIALRRLNIHKDSTDIFDNVLSKSWTLEAPTYLKWGVSDSNTALFLHYKRFSGSSLISEKYFPIIPSVYDSASLGVTNKMLYVKNNISLTGQIYFPSVSLQDDGTNLNFQSSATNGGFIFYFGDGSTSSFKIRGANPSEILKLDTTTGLTIRKDISITRGSYYLDTNKTASIFPQGFGINIANTKSKGDVFFISGLSPSKFNWLKYKSESPGVFGSDTVSLMKLDSANGLDLTYGTYRQNGTALIIRGSGTLDFGNISPQGLDTLGFAVTGVSAGDPIALGFTDIVDAGGTIGVIYQAYCRIANWVTVRATNITGGFADPLSQTYKVSIIK